MAGESRFSTPVQALLSTKQLVTEDLETLLKSGRQRWERLLENLLADGDLLASPEPPDDAILALAKRSNVDPTLFLAAWRLGNWIVESTGETDLKTIVSDFCEAGFVRADAHAELAKLFNRLFETTSQVMAVRRSVSRAMPTFESIEVACDLRIPHARELRSQRLPVGVIRITTDEGEVPIVFQCTSADLGRIAEAAEEARKILDSLRTVKTEKKEK